ncbi:MAG: tRNA pseudouridine(13) synthase TruD [Deltaproteobacteria bacterium]|nr:tRNA pseudouridine(13) synthase TruD [Deltaproteobacteria bacterium]
MKLPYLTADLPGIGGTLKSRDEDFVVEEIPAYPPSGTGDHVFVRYEKRGLTTPQAVTVIARALGVRDRDIGVAGMKDRQAVTTQWISLPPPVTPEVALALVLDQVRVLEAVRHNHKLRTGHLRGNRFRLVVRSVTGEAAGTAAAILSRLVEPPGAPNWYGEQRFGRDGDNAQKGRALVLGERPLGRDRKLDRLMVSSLQSELFNHWLVARLADGLYRSAIPGDVMHKVAGGMFDSTEPDVDGPRVAMGEIVPTGPMFGVSMRAPAPGSAAAEREATILAASGLTLESFATVRAIAEGTRRDAAIAITDATVAAVEDTLEVTFALPAGAYATAVMRELMKPE